MDIFASKEDSFRQRLKEQLEIWYAKFPAGKNSVRSSRADNIPRVNCQRSALLDDPDVQDDEVAGPTPAVGCATVLVAREVVVNEWMFLYKFQIRFEYFEDSVVDYIG